MAVITYTAKRKHVAKDQAVAASDISAAASDDSFNTTAFDFSGLLAGEFVYVEGFTNAANNGWHEVASDSTTTKIIVTSALVDEAAGGDITITFYEHGDGEVYSLEFKMRQYEEVPVAEKEVSQSLSRVRETQLFNEAQTFQISTNHIDEANKKYWREFFSSVRAGENFTFDAHGTIASPDVPQTAELIGIESWQRWNRALKHFASFTIEVLDA